MKATGQMFKYVDLGRHSGGIAPFGFDISIAGARQGVFGFMRSGNNFAVYTLQNGLIQDMFGDKIAAYGPDEFTVSYRSDGNKIYQEVNGFPVSLRDSGITQYPDRFYLDIAPESDVDLSIYGKTPEIDFSNLIQSTGNGFYGFFQDPTTTGIRNIYHLNSVTTTQPFVGIAYPEVIYGSGGYFVTGSGLSGLTSLPLTFDFAFGKVQKDIPIVYTGIQTGVPTGQSIAIFGEGGIIQPWQPLGFTTNYYSNVTDNLNIELSYEALPVSVPLVGAVNNGTRMFSGYIKRRGLLYSDYASGIANLTGSLNTGMNQGYVLIDTNIQVFDHTPMSMYTVYYGQNSGWVRNVMMTGIYTGPEPGLVGLLFSGSGDYHYNVAFNSGHGGVMGLGTVVGKLNKDNPFYVNNVKYDYDPQIFPTGLATGYISEPITGEGYMRVYSSPHSFTGWGTGRIISDIVSVDGVGFGTVYCKGDISLSGQSLEMGSYFQESFFPDAEKESDGGYYTPLQPVSAWGQLPSFVGAFASGSPIDISPDWGYPKGTTYIVYDSERPVGARVVANITPDNPDYPPGEYTGIATVPPMVIPGPVFTGDAKNTGEFNWVSPYYQGTAKFGRGLIISGKLDIPLEFKFYDFWEEKGTLIHTQTFTDYDSPTEIWPRSAPGQYSNYAQFDGYPIPDQGVPYLVFENTMVNYEKFGGFYGRANIANQNGIYGHFTFETGIVSGSGMTPIDATMDLSKYEASVSMPTGYSSFYSEVTRVNEFFSGLNIIGKLRVYTDSNTGEINLRTINV